VPEPFVVPPGVRVNVQVPVPGRPFNTTLPVADVQLGWVIAPITGIDGVTGCVLTGTLAEFRDVHPSEFATVKKKVVPAIRPVMVRVVPVPVKVVPSGNRVRVQVPEAGNPLSATLPVATVQVG